MPRTRSGTRSGTPDGARRAAVVAGAALAVAGSAVGSGAFGGTPVAEAAGGALSASATLVAPAGPAFGIWGVVYAGLVAHAVWQALPAQREDARQRRTGWWTAASLVLNAAWILTVQAGQLAASVAVIAALLVVLVVAFTRLLERGPRSLVEAVVVDGTTGLYLGWVSIATVANTAAALRQAGLRSGEGAWAVGVLALAAAVGVVTAVRSRGRLAPGAGLVWGLGWVAAGRAGGENPSTAAAVAAGAAAAVVAGTTVAARLAPRGRRLRRARPRPRG
ncbi:tryptophan-rich sensory protein [Kineococcus sp. T13]|nr:tryptophan-rich sensory protein [Kineococcus vitellinus]NAZ77455.1 tryptophan-rich sensory protein [Kineococcus vitellinus]